MAQQTRIKKKLSYRTQGRTYIAEQLSTQELFAMKKEEYLSEADKARVRLVCSFQFDVDMCIVKELCENNLRKMISELQKLSEPQGVTVSAEFLIGKHPFFANYETETNVESNQINSGGRSHVQSIERVAEFVMNAESDVARTEAAEENKRGNAFGARTILKSFRQRSKKIQKTVSQQQKHSKAQKPASELAYLLTLFKQQQDLDDIEQQLEASEGNAKIQSHLVKQIKQRTYSNAMGKNSSAAYATAASISTALPNQKK
ncbi:MAG: hypothetical protein EZS28_016903 [Streblomastix strix]|uniref:Uncharacterized protein n=1 Tax=Streblomastix strix TaxID=222440 RepID=A0A5J4VY48_9EUKA|nr:MAG: hypothetical protein EZS28_016902 [Streblomastix strix]KAA6387571.1 MAG: hypothetical protein EZS28_016903 [Streblomastix strix]